MNKVTPAFARSIGQIIREARERKAMSQAALARALGVSRQAVNMWESGANFPGVERLATVCGLLDIDLLGPEFVRPAQPEQEAKHSKQRPRDIVTFSAMPIRGEIDKFLLHDEKHFSRRPPGILPSAHVACLLLPNSTMTPWRFPNDPVFFDYRQSPRVGDHVVVRLTSTRGRRDQEVSSADDPHCVKLLTGIGENDVRLKQYFPDREVTVRPSSIVDMYRVIDWAELLGPLLVSN